eukprot:CAMPEP_0119561592 /NCGR_PEP_ID=MMETSP1352-20130426/18062_1 /TAXON_ID=265584 /ORGANISM="Stauroneis constricta, Strain CCMP1120" /LENGTH=53 /DNA_ID=CAMNT_0007609827 /DNA_START=1 /DNA_END=158 /DNA_ORIENTATION=+
MDPLAVNASDVDENKRRLGKDPLPSSVTGGSIIMKEEEPRRAPAAVIMRSSSR